MLLVKMVRADWSREVRLLNLYSIEGSKRAIVKSDHVQTSVEQFATGDEEALETLKETMFTASADGEPAEQLSMRLLKESKFFPNLGGMLRCSLHAGQGELEIAIMSDARVAEIVCTLVTRLAGAGDSQHGSFSRAVKNSVKLSHLLSTSVRAGLKKLTTDVESLCNDGHAISPQRR